MVRSVCRVLGPCDVEIEDTVRSDINDQRGFQLLNRQLHSFRVALRGATSAEACYANPHNTVSQEQ